jgi:3-mercaptopyruvate sulfurtransferase SseA
MSEKVMKKGKAFIATLLGVIAVVSLTIWGCGTSGYDGQTAGSQAITKTDTALIDAATLKGWVDAGLVNKQAGYERVVILDVSTNPVIAPATTPSTDDSTNAYNTVGHIPGAQLVSAGSAAFVDNTRAEGPMSITGSMVCTGATMDALIQKAGIDATTTIVLTTNGTSALNLTRAYTTFRYWGFPKSRIKVLQSGNAGWTAAGYALTSNVPSIQKSTYGVAQNGKSNVNTDMRVSLSEMIAYVKGIVAGNASKVYILDTVRDATQISKTTDLLDTTRYTPFDGAVKGSYRYPLANVITGVTFKTAAEIKAAISAAVGADKTTTIGDANRDSAKTLVAMCRAGNNASQAYFVLDGIAYYDSNVDIKWYDGSLGQWNLCASKDHLALNGTNAGGKLAVGSIWDTTSLMDNLTWNVDRGLTIVDYGVRVYGVEPSFAEGNQIETADKAYRSAVTGTTGGSGSSGGGGC